MDRPTERTRRPRRGLSRLLMLFAVSAVSFWLGRLSVQQELERLREERAKDRPPSLQAAPTPPAAPAREEESSAPESQVEAEPPARVAEAKRPAPKAEPAPAPGEMRELAVEIRGSVTRTLHEAVGKRLGDPLAQVTGRLLVWWLDVARDLRKGDALRLIYDVPEGSEPRIHALSYTSNKFGKTFEAFRFQAPGAEFPRYYDRDGNEVELRLERSPIERYEQITSLLRDGRGHQGVDFKAPTGMPVVAPFAGVVARTNFNQRVNGRCVEIEDAQGRRFLFLHLAELAPEMRPGARVTRGQLVGFSGNTGRSTAPHLHYQIMSKAGRVLDPMKVHETYRVRLPREHLPAFREAVERYDRRFRVAAAD